MFYTGIFEAVTSYLDGNIQLTLDKKSDNDLICRLVLKNALSVGVAQWSRLFKKALYYLR